MAITESTVNTLKQIWPDINEEIERMFKVTALALSRADDPKTISQLQGKLRAITGMQQLPEHLEMLVNGNKEGGLSNDELDQRGY